MKAKIVLFSFLFILFCCNKDNIDTISPAEVSNLNLVYSDTIITLNWTDPIDKDLNTIEISYNDTIIEVLKGIQSQDIRNLEIGKNYIFVLRTIDYTGNKSEGIQIQGKIDYRLRYAGNFEFFSYNWFWSIEGETTLFDTMIFIGRVSIIENSDSLIQIKYREGKQTTICGIDSVFGAYIEPNINTFGELSYSRVLGCSIQSYFNGQFSHFDTLNISIASGGQGFQQGQIIKGTRIK